jgi:hypothetical protein
MGVFQKKKICHCERLCEAIWIAAIGLLRKASQQQMSYSYRMPHVSSVGLC